MAHSTKSRMTDEQIDNLVDNYINLYERACRAMRQGMIKDLAEVTDLEYEDIREIWSDRHI